MKNDIHIIQLVYSFEIEGGGGGVTRSALDIAEYIKDSCKVSVISLGDFGTSFEHQRVAELKDHGIEVFAATKWNEQTPYISFMNSIQTITKYISKIKSRPIIHSHSEFTDIVALYIKTKWRATPIIRTCHYGYIYEWKNKPVRRIIFTNLLYPIYFNYEIGVNSSITNRLNNRLFTKLLNKKAILIGEGINLDRFQAPKPDITKIKKLLNLPNNAIIIGSVGRLVEQKGHKFLLLAAQEVINNYPNTHFVIVGDGPLRKDLERLSEELGINQNISFLGSRSDVKELLLCFDIFVLPSLWEGLPISLLESMASKIPIVTTSIPGCSDVIEDGINGMLSPPMDASTLGQKIIQMIESESLRHTLADNAYHTVQGYEISIIAKKYYSLYLSLIK